ncbi:oxysterol binding protein [Scenedesmus sp. NREL 46B-D3]|nr:oxysterol binding protein [Scenedesmus sp. NREL 46B-D3]
MDVTSLMSVPLFIMEPFSMLQKMAEIMEYTQLLDDADKSDDQFERLALVAAFLVSPFGAAERTWKPFNPLLGETFELEGLGSNVCFMAEQVCEQPPVSRTRISLRRSGEVFSHVPPQAKVHNLVLGRTWVDSYGAFLVTNTATGDKVQLEFKQCGWFGAGQYEFDGHVMDAEGNAKFAMSGKWNSCVDMCACSPDGSPIADAPVRRLWTCAEKPAEDHYGCTHFAWHLNSTKYLSRPPLASDSRRRADRQALQERKMTEAAAEKQAIDTQQQQQHKEFEQRGEQWQACWFEPAPDMQVLPGEEPAEVVPLWRWNGKYSSARDGMPAGSDDWRDGVMGKGFATSQQLALKQ